MPPASKKAERVIEAVLGVAFWGAIAFAWFSSRSWSGFFKFCLLYGAIAGFLIWLVAAAIEAFVNSRADADDLIQRRARQTSEHEADRP